MTHMREKNAVKKNCPWALDLLEKDCYIIDQLL